jgi:TolB-like protein/Flp pilus assembly protein TadD
MTLRAGIRLGAYEILSPLGAGGMGEVYRARDAKLDRDVAVKVLPASVANDPDALARFEREAKAVGGLSHPNILAIHDFGRHEGVVYAVTELLEGETLRERLERSPVSQKQSVEYGLQIAKGLSAAHERGIVHRDLKPENVFVMRDGHVKILDFGLAKRVEAAMPGQATNVPTVEGQTEPGKVMGTVGYMSPEQARGLPADHRSDLFSFGAILYELLSGRRAFKKDTPGDTLASIIRDEPEELTGSGRNVSPALDHIVRHCLEKDPGDRFQSAKDIAFALSEASGPTTVTSAVHAVPAPLAGRRRVLVAALVVAAVLAGVGIFLGKRPKAGSPASGGIRRVAVLPFENLGAPEDDYFADGIADAIRGKLTAVQGLEVIARGSSTPYKKTTKTPQEIARELDAHYLLSATVRWQKGAKESRVQVSPELVEIKEAGAPASRWQQQFDAPLTDVFEMQSDIASRVAQSLGVALAAADAKQLAEKPTQSLPAYDVFLKGEEASAGLAVSDPPSLRRSLTFYEQAVALDPGFARAWARVSLASSLLYGNSRPAPELAERAREAAHKAVTLSPGSPEGYFALGQYGRTVARNPGAALEQYARGQRLAPANAEILTAAAGAEQSLGRWDAAVEHLRQAERLDPRSVATKRRLGQSLLWLRRYPEARAALDRGLALAPAALNLIEYRAMTFLGQGDLAAARAYLETGARGVEPTELVVQFANFWDLYWVLDGERRELLRRLPPSAFDGDRGTWGICLAEAYAQEKDLSNARVHAEEARKAFEEQLRETPDNPQRNVFLGLALAYLGRKEEAIRQGERGVALQPLAQDAYFGAYLQHQLARIYLLVGEPEKALDRLEPLLRVPYLLSPGWLKVDPNFDTIRGNPRFQKLVAGG